MRLTMVSYALVALLVTLSCLCAVNALSVTRGKEPDIFTTPVPTKGRTQSARQKVCTRMRGSCRPGTLCMECNCPRDRPTFILFRGECVKNQEVREIFDSSRSPNDLVQYLNATIYSDGKPLCQSKQIPTIAFNNQNKTQRKRLAICKGNKEDKGAFKQSSQATVPVLKCTVTDVKYLNESTNETVPEEEKGKSIFTVQEQNKRLKLFLKWRSAQKVKGSSSLVGTILLILFNCRTNKTGSTTQLAVRLIVKIAGQKQWDVFTTEAPTASEAATTAAMRRASSVTVALSVMGSLVVIFSICGVAFLLRRRQRKRENATAKERPIERSNQTNPTYGRDSNIFMMNEERSVADSEEDSAYESVTQNTQATNAQITYETPQAENVSRHLAEEPIFAPDTNRPQEMTEQESQYQPLFRQRTVLQDLDREGNQKDTPKTERDYAVLEDPSEDPDGAAGDPVYHVVEQ